MSLDGINLSATTDKLINKDKDQVMVDSNGLVVVFMKATGAKMAPYSMGDAFMETTTTLVL